MTRREQGAYIAVAALMLVLLSGCARRPVGQMTAAPSPAPRAEDMVVAGAQAGAAGAQERATVTEARPDTPVVESSPAPEPPAATPEVKAEGPATPAAPEAPATSMEAPAPSPEAPATSVVAEAPSASPEIRSDPTEAPADTVRPAATESAQAPEPRSDEPMAPRVAPAPVEPAPVTDAAPADVQVAAAAASPVVESPAPAPAVEEFRPVQTLNDIHFDFDEYVIRPDDARILDENVAWLKTNQSYLILIEGHADERGTSEYNLALGEHRAKAAMSYLGALGVRTSRMTIISYGKERPFCVEREEACWAQNRRAHILVKPQ